MNILLEQQKLKTTIVRAITNESVEIMTQRLFNFAILNSKNNIQNIDHILVFD